MTIDEKLISRLENLAKLSLSPKEKELLKSDLEKMIHMVNKLKELDTAGIAPLIQMTDRVNILRKDVPGDLLEKKEALSNASKHDEDFFMVPNLFKNSQKNK